MTTSSAAPFRTACATSGARGRGQSDVPFPAPAASQVPLTFDVDGPPLPTSSGRPIPAAVELLGWARTAAGECPGAGGAPPAHSANVTLGAVFERPTSRKDVGRVHFGCELVLPAPTSTGSVVRALAGSRILVARFHSRSISSECPGSVARPAARGYPGHRAVPAAPHDHARLSPEADAPMSARRARGGSVHFVSRSPPCLPFASTG